MRVFSSMDIEVIIKGQWQFFNFLYIYFNIKIKKIIFFEVSIVFKVYLFNLYLMFFGSFKNIIYVKFMLIFCVIYLIIVW